MIVIGAYMLLYNVGFNMFIYDNIINKTRHL